MPICSPPTPTTTMLGTLRPPAPPGALDRVNASQHAAAVGALPAPCGLPTTVRSLSLPATISKERREPRSSLSWSSRRGSSAKFSSENATTRTRALCPECWRCVVVALHELRTSIKYVALVVGAALILLLVLTSTDAPFGVILFAGSAWMSALVYLDQSRMILRALCLARCRTVSGGGSDVGAVVTSVDSVARARLGRLGSSGRSELLA